MKKRKQNPKSSAFQMHGRKQSLINVGCRRKSKHNQHTHHKIPTVLFYLSDFDFIINTDRNHKNKPRTFEKSERLGLKLKKGLIIFYRYLIKVF